MATPQFKASIDGIEFGDGFVLVEGWCVSSTDGSTPADLHISVDDANFFPIRSFRARPDLIASGVSRGEAGFRIDLPLRSALPDTPIVTLFSPAAKSGLRLSGMRLSDFGPRGALDRADAGGVEGWVYHPAGWHGGAPAQLIIDGDVSVPVTPALSRPDVVAALGVSPRPFGFRVDAREIAAVLAAAGRSDGQTGRPDREVTLVAGQLVLDTLTMPAAPRRQGNLEGVRDGRVHGWAVNRDAPETPASVEIDVDGVPYLSTMAGRPRADLAALGISANGGGFSAACPSSPTGTAAFTLTARIAGSREPLGGKMLRVAGRARAEQRPDWLRAAHDIQAAGRPVAIVVPVHNAPDALSACLESLKAHTTLPCRLLLIDDASTDPRVATVLDRAADWPDVTVVRNDANLGFAQSCNQGFALTPGCDVVLLNSDTVVGPRWLENLRLAAYSGPRIGTATPLSDNAGVFSAPEPNQPNATPPGWDIADMARLVAQTAHGALPNVPTGHGFCLFIRRDCLDAIGGFDAQAFPRGYGEENDFCMRATRAGFGHVMDDRSYVHHERSASFGAQKAELYGASQAVLQRRYPEYRTLTRLFATSGAILNVRWRLRRALKQATARPKPRLLFVIATETGGTPQTNRDLMRALADRYEPWLLHCDCRQLSLSRFEEADDRMSLVERHDLDDPVEMATHRSRDYARLVADCLVRFAIDLVHIRHIAWHGIDLPQICQALSVPVVFSFHDFYTICPSTKLLDRDGMPCCLAREQTAAPCDAELWPAEGAPPLKPDFVPLWRETMAQALMRCDAFVTTSAAAKSRLCATFPTLGEREFRVIPHGRDFAAMADCREPRRAGAPLKILVPGNISSAKGACLIRDLVALDTGRSLECHILGDAGALSEAPGLVIHGRYGREDFQERVRAIGPAIGAVLSRWPETWCHTLTEMWACGLPVFATDLGAPGERIARHGGGWLHDPAATAETTLRRLRALAEDPGEIASRADEVMTWQRGPGAEQSCAVMAAAYDALYRHLFERSRSLAGHACEAETVGGEPRLQAPGGRPG